MYAPLSRAARTSVTRRRGGTDRERLRCRASDDHHCVSSKTSRPTDFRNRPSNQTQNPMAPSHLISSNTNSSGVMVPICTVESGRTQATSLVSSAPRWTHNKSGPRKPYPNALGRVRSDYGVGGGKPQKLRGLLLIREMPARQPPCLSSWTRASL